MEFGQITVRRHSVYTVCVCGRITVDFAFFNHNSR